jgi:ABC-type branched-subunit amino acid transport system substrate-binding protein
MAIEDVNNKTDGVFDDLLPGTELRVIPRLTSNEFLDGAINAQQTLEVVGEEIKAALGPPSFDGMKGAAPVFDQFGTIPFLSYGERASTFGNSELYPNLLSTIPADYYDGYVLANVIAHYFKWEKVSVFATGTDLGRGCTLLFRHYATLYGINILSSHSLDASQEDYTSEISRAKHLGARIIVMFVEGAVAIRLIQQGSQIKFRNSIQILSGERLSSDSWLNQNATVMDYIFLAGYIGVKLHYYAPTSALKSHFLNRWKSRTDTISSSSSDCDLTRDFYNQSYLYRYDPPEGGSPICTGVQFSKYSQDPNLLNTLNDVMYAYDAVLAIAKGLHELMYLHDTPDPSPAALHSYLLSNLSLTGLTGQVSFSTELVSDDFNVGGRHTGVVYDIFNFVPNITSPDLDDSFPVITSWYSESGVPKCQNVSYFVNGNPCNQFLFNTLLTTKTDDSPDPVRRDMIPIYYLVLLKVLSLLGLTVTVLAIALTMFYRKRRLVKMSQPILSYITLFGITLAFVRVFLSMNDLTDPICVAMLWIEQLAFQIIFGAVLIRAWRVYQITASLQRKKITDLTCALYLLLWISPVLLLLLFSTLDGSIQMRYVTVVHTQYEFILEPTCDYSHTATLQMLMFLYDAITVLVGLRWCWNIRKVRSTICNTPILVQSTCPPFAPPLPLPLPTLSFSLFNIRSGLLTAFGTIGLSLVALSLLSLTPLYQEFFIGMVICVLMLRLLWLFEAKRSYHVLAGYDLDQGLVLRQSEKSILATLASHTKRVATITVASSDPESQHLQKYSNPRSKEELDMDIRRLREEILIRQEELAYVENMIFVISESSTSNHYKPEKEVVAAGAAASQSPVVAVAAASVPVTGDHQEK